ncbi:unnamed protein product [Durusdinium trenchii]|uniref:Uncharacterized protein n=1 Tax=Durusdinium trenchii TaxID=1381693 RepID=A0ABP0HU24_9DINO
MRSRYVASARHFAPVRADLEDCLLTAGELLRCPNDCSESGDCDTDGFWVAPVASGRPNAVGEPNPERSDTGVCSCFSGYSAVDCSLTPDWKVPLLNCIDIILTWGLKGHELDNASAPEFDPRFELLAAPETQAAGRPAGGVGRTADCVAFQRTVFRGASWSELEAPVEEYTVLTLRVLSDPESDVESIVAEPCYILDEEEEFQLVDDNLRSIDLNDHVKCVVSFAIIELSRVNVRDELPCWIEGPAERMSVRFDGFGTSRNGFETFVNAVGGMFPAVWTEHGLVEDPDLASQALQATGLYAPGSGEEVLWALRDVVTDGVDYGGRLYFTMVRLKINVAQNANTTYRPLGPQEAPLRWRGLERHARAVERLGAAAERGSTFQGRSDAHGLGDVDPDVVQSTLLAFSASISVSLLAVAVFSQNVVIAIYVCMNILLVIGVLSGFLLNVMGYEFGVVEAIGATIFVGLSVDYCLHLAHAYNQAPGVNSKQKMRHALVVIGPSILGGALTTIMGSAFLLPCRILLFQKLGWTLFANSAVSMLFTFSFLSPMLLICGPVGRTGDLCCCLRRGGSLSDRWAEERHGTINLDQMTEESSAAAAFRAQAERRAGTLHLDSLESNVNAAADAFSAQARLKAGTIHLDALESRVSAAAAAFKEHGGGPRTDDRGSPSACVIGEVAGSPKAAVPSEPSSVSLFVPEEPSSVNLDPVVLGKSIRV